MRRAGVLALVSALFVAVALPHAAPAYHVTLMLPFMAYGIALLGPLGAAFVARGSGGFGWAGGCQKLVSLRAPAQLKLMCT